MSDFRNWLLKQRTRDDNIGKMATWAYNCPTWDGKQQTLKKCLEEKYIQGLKTFEKARIEFRNRPVSPKSSARGPYELSYRSFTKIFNTKDDIREYYKNLKDSNYDRTLTGSDYDSVMALFKYHPTVIIPTENSVDEYDIEIKVSQHSIDANYCFHFNAEEHSYQTAIQCVGHVDEEQRRKKVIINKFINTARLLIKDQMQDCSSDENCDHVIFFTHLLFDWFLTTGISLDDVKFIGHGTERKFESDELNESWINYHRENAILRVISKSQNMERKPAVTNWFVLFT